MIPRLLRTTVPLLAVLLGPAGVALAAGAITSGTNTTGNIAGPSFNEVWTFSATNKNRVLVSAVTTSGSLNTVIRLKDPSNTEVWNSSADRLDYQCLATGTYTLTIEDSGLNDTGAYAISFLNVTAGPLTTVSDPDGGAIVSNDVKSGQMHTITDFDAYTFSGTAGDRILFGALATGGTGYNTSIALYPPDGSAAEANTFSGDFLDAKLERTGTYTVVIEDYGNTHTGMYAVSLMNVTAGPFTNVSDADGGTIASGDVKSGTYQTAPDFDVFSFTGAGGNRVIIDAVVTSGTSVNTVIYLYPPGGGAAVVATTADRVEYQLLATGTYTILMADNGLNDTGSYTLSLLNVTAGPLTTVADPDGGAITSNAVLTGQMNAIVDFDAFTFNATAGHRVLIGAVATGGTSFNTSITLYPPGGGPSEAATFSGDFMDVQLNVSGMYTAVIEDYGNTHTGTYSVSYVNASAGPYTTVSDANGGSTSSGAVATGSFQTIPDFDVYTFSASAGQRLLLDAVMTSGTANSVIYLYPPGGGNAVVATTADRIEWLTTTTGTYSLLIADSGLDQTGDYTISMLNVTAGPLTTGSDPDGGPIASSELKTGQMNAIVDFDAFTFSGTAGHRVVVGALATGGLSFNTSMTLYPPNGGAAEASTFSGDRLDKQLEMTGTYTVVVEDYGNTHTGTYSLTLMNLTAGPFTSVSDPDGGAIVSDETRVASFQTTPDFDVYTFDGTAGDRVIIASVVTSGTPNTTTYLYPPYGGAAVVQTTADRAEYQLLTTGTYTILEEDSGIDATGGYTLSMFNITSGPWTTLTDADAGDILSSTVKTGQMHSVVDFDAFRFFANGGDRVLIGAVATGGIGFNTTATIYPPGGGTSEASSFSSDRLDTQVSRTGVYTVVVEDYGNTHTGTYSLTHLNVTHGPYTTSSDLNGNALVNNTTRSASMQGVPDFDGYFFYGAAGDTVYTIATTLSGTMNTSTYIYPPYGGAAVAATTADNVTYALTTTGFYTVVIEDSGLDETGSYNLYYRKSGTTVGVDDPSLVPAAVSLETPRPNPFVSTTRVAFGLPAERPVTLRVFDMRGALVRTIVDQSLRAGAYSYAWDGRTDGGVRVPGGVYYAELRAGRDVKRQRIVCMR